MKIQTNWAPFRRIAIVSVGVLLMTLAFWILKQSSSATVDAATTLGSPLPNLTSLETTLFTTGFTPFTKQWSLRSGLGPVYTQVDCKFCHASPVIGGGSNGNTKKDTLFGTINTDGSFNPLTNEGGILEQDKSISQFKPNCVLAGEVIPSDATLIDSRLAPQAFGMGLINSIPDSVIQAQAVYQDENQPMGVAGITNMIVDENGVLSVGKFGYKGEAASLEQFVALALNGELGITTPVFPLEQLPQGNPIPPACNVAAEPNDDGTQMMAIFHYLLYLAPNPPPQNVNQNGQALFNSIGCAICHLPPGTYVTGPKVSVPLDWPETTRVIFSKALSSQPVNAYSDLLLHNMGSAPRGLGDGFPMGLATGNMFRTTPLWGLSTRTFYLHDGTTNSLDTAIRRHGAQGSEAFQVIQNYKALSSGDQSDLIAFINSL